MTDTPEPDTSTDAVERLAVFAAEAARYFEGRPIAGEDSAFWANVTNAETCRKIAATLRAVVVQRAGWKEAFDRSSRLRASDARERRHLVAEMTRRGHLDLLREIDADWLAETAAHAETHGSEPTLAADTVGRLVAVARAAHEYTTVRGDDGYCDLCDALDALPSGVLDQSD